MLGFGHQTVFGLCLALLVLTGVSIVCVALLFIERQDVELLRQHVNNLRQENTLLRSTLEDYRSGITTRPAAATRPSD